MKNCVLKRWYSLTAVLLPRLTFWPQSPLVAPTYPSVAQPLGSAESCAHLYPSHDLTAEQLTCYLRRFATQQFRKQNLHLAMAIWPSKWNISAIKISSRPSGLNLEITAKNKSQEVHLPWQNKNGKSILPTPTPKEGSQRHENTNWKGNSDPMTKPKTLLLPK